MALMALISGIPARTRRYLYHDLSPLPLLMVFVGFWLPLDWALRGWAVLANTTVLEKAQAIANSVLFNFLPAGLALAGLVYLLSSISIFFRLPYREGVRRGMLLLSNLMLVLSTALSIKLMGWGSAPCPPPVKWTILGMVPFATYWLWTRKIGFFNRLGIPCGLTLALVPLAIFLVATEGVQSAIRRPPTSILKGASATSKCPDIVLITMDACSAKHLSAYGYNRKTSPQMDAFAKENLLFENFYSNANWTSPGIASLLNGTRPWAHDADLGMPRREVTETRNLLGCLSREGYDIRTQSSNAYANHSWQRTPVVPDEQVLFPFLGPPVPTCLAAFPTSMYAFGIGPAAYIKKIYIHYMGPNRIVKPVAYAKAVLRNQPPIRPRFFWIHFSLPHDPYSTLAPFLGQFDPSPQGRSIEQSYANYRFLENNIAGRQTLMAARYDEAILAVDAAIGELLRELKSLGRYDQSLIAITADHGESFSRGYGGHGGPLLTEELVRVPLILKLPGHQAPARITQPYEQADFAPTILHVAGLPIPKGMEGLPFPLKPAGLPIFTMNRDLSSTPHTFSVGMRLGAWKYITHLGKWEFSLPQKELYNLELDPGETTNLMAQQPDMANLMNNRIMKELAQRGLSGEAP